MATYAKRTLSRRPDGQFHRTIGKVADASGRLKPKRFMLGTDDLAAREAAVAIERLWADIEAAHAKQLLSVLDLPVAWTPETLAMAEAIRRGERIQVADTTDDETPLHLAERAGWLAQTYPSIRNKLDVEPEAKLQQGRNHLLAYARDAAKAADEADRQNPHRRTARELAALALKPAAADLSGQSLHASLDAWGDAMALRYARDGQATETGRKFRDIAERLKHAHADLPLSQLTYSAIEGMADYWCSRPEARKSDGRGRGTPVSVVTVKNTLKNLRRFLRWLHRSDRFCWRDTDRVIEDATTGRQFNSLLSAAERKVIAAGPDAWTLDELITLYTYATDRDRLLILLGLNGGFAQSEVIHLAKTEIHLDAETPHVAFVRHKSCRPGGFALWPETVRALRWNESRRNRVESPDNPWALLAESGQPLTGMRIANAWNKLLRRTQRHAGSLRRLPFKYLRKTAAALIQQEGGGAEVIALMEARAKRTSHDDHADVYYRRVVQKVWEFNAKVGNYLRPMFDAAPGAHTEQVHQRLVKVTPPMREAMQTLRKHGLSLRRISDEMGVSSMTVARHTAEIG
jgi:site-specific recombinase XerD